MAPRSVPRAASCTDEPTSGGGQPPAAPGSSGPCASPSSRPHRALSLLALSLILALAAGLRFANLTQLGLSNHYYAAAVVGMQSSWRNLLFVAAEPGGSVSVDKPPLGLWLQVASVRLLGMNTLGVLLPQLLAGMCSILLVYHLTRRCLGAPAGLLAALVLAVTPVVVATDRSSTIDSTLIMALLLSAWAFAVATETSKLRPLLLGALALGAAFNVKMLQAFLPLPAFYAYYLLGSRERFGRKVGRLVLASVLLGLVSLSWALFVDLTPASQRPFVGGSDTNSALELIVGYNGLARLLGVIAPTSVLGSAVVASGAIASSAGEPGPLRLLTEPLAREASWLLPVALAALVLLLLQRKQRWPAQGRLQLLILWGGWLAVTGAFFSASSIHEYYLATLAPPLAVLTAAGCLALYQLCLRRARLGAGVALAVAGATLLFQRATAWPYVGTTTWQLLAVALYVGGAALLLGAASGNPAKGLTLPGTTCLLAAALLTPAIWSGLTARYPNAKTSAFAGKALATLPKEGVPLKVDAALLDHLQARTQDVTYLMAVPSSVQGSDYVLATGRAVLYLGGFMGEDEAVTVAQLDEMLCNGELRYLYWSRPGAGAGGRPHISAWAARRCVVVPGFETSSRIRGIPDGTLAGARASGAGVLQLTLYECACAEP